MTSKAAGWVYAAQEDGTPLVKIGFTRLSRAETRVHTLRFQYHVPFTLIAAMWLTAGARRVERAIHELLAAQRIEGEFFYLHMSQAYLQTLIEMVLPNVRRDLHLYAIEKQRTLERHLQRKKRL